MYVFDAWMYRTYHHRGGSLSFDISNMRHKTPDLDELLEGCKRFALLDYSASGGSPAVHGRFIESVLDALKAARKDDLAGYGSIMSLLKSVSVDSPERFESDIDKAFIKIKDLAAHH
jgi:hypothetical protein